MQDQKPPKNQPSQSGDSSVANPINQPQTATAHKETEPVKISQVGIDKTSAESIEIAPSHHPEVAIPGELETIIEKGSDAKEPVIQKEPPQSDSLPKESINEIKTPWGFIRLPMTYANALQKKKNTNIKYSLHWLAALIIYQWKKYDSDVTRK
jgi:hypothetical protein